MRTHTRLPLRCCNGISSCFFYPSFHPAVRNRLQTQRHQRGVLIEGFADSTDVKFNLLQVDQLVGSKVLPPTPLMSHCLWHSWCSCLTTGQPLPRHHLAARARSLEATLAAGLEVGFGLLPRPQGIRFLVAPPPPLTTSWL